jgi:hypothetical protein
VYIIACGSARPLVPIHVRATPQRTSAARPVSPTDPSYSVGTDQRRASQTITPTRCEPAMTRTNKIVRTGGGPKQDTKRTRKVNMAARRSHPHTDRVALRIATGMSLTQLGMYCEPQRDMQCSVHALNAMAGRKIADGPAVSSMLYNYWPEGRSDNRPSAMDVEATTRSVP